MCQAGRLQRKGAKEVAGKQALSGPVNEFTGPLAIRVPRQVFARRDATATEFAGSYSS